MLGENCAVYIYIYARVCFRIGIIDIAGVAVARFFWSVLYVRYTEVNK